PADWNSRDTAAAVSYTHLDVYKRQMLFLLGWCGAALIARLRRGLAFGERLRRLAGGGNAGLGGADRQRRRSLSAKRWWTEPGAGAAAGRPSAAAGAKDQPPADRRAAAQ
ncbi:cytochrome c biogenesis protein, partial [Klebsiella pneumoniae]